MKAVSHIIAIVVLAGVLFAWPVLALCNFSALPAALGLAQVDAVSSATAIVDAPSGKFTIYINRTMHDSEELPTWEAFFRGEPVPLLMEDVTCTALADDPSGAELADSLRTRLPENQMMVRIEDPLLAVSKAEAGMFDVLVLSDERAAAYSTQTLEAKPDVTVVHR